MGYCVSCRSEQVEETVIHLTCQSPVLAGERKKRFLESFFLDFLTEVLKIAVIMEPNKDLAWFRVGYAPN